MKFELYEATDKRDNRKMMWLRDLDNNRVATFCHKWAPSRIKHRTAAAPDSIIWEDGDLFKKHAILIDRIDVWEFSL